MTIEEQETLFQQWLRDHIGLMLKVVRGCAGTSHDQEDLFQDVLVNLWSSLPRFRGDAKETTWIYRVAFNTALAWRRGERRRTRQQTEYLKWGTTFSAGVPITAESPAQQQIERLYLAIRTLSKVDASLAIMHLDGLSYQEMSQVLGISENYIGVKLNRIRKQLSEELQGDSE